MPGQPGTYRYPVVPSARAPARRYAGGFQAEGDPARRAFAVTELQAFFDYADAQVTRSRGGGRKGWLAVFRDATMFKAAYGFGLRRTETGLA